MASRWVGEGFESSTNHFVWHRNDYILHFDADENEMDGLVAAVHQFAKLAFFFGSPISAIELQKYRRVGNRKIGLEEQNSEGLSGFIEVFDDVFVKGCFGRLALEEVGQIVSISCDSRRFFLGNERQLFVKEDIGHHVFSLREFSEYGLKDVDLRGVSNDGSDSRAILSRISRIRNDNPVPVSEKRNLLLQFRSPRNFCNFWLLKRSRKKDGCKRKGTDHGTTL